VDVDLICVVVLVVVLRRHSSQNCDDDDDDNQSNYEEGDEVGQNMDSTDFRPYNMRCPMLRAHCGGARGAYLYNNHAYNALNTGGHRMF